MTRGVNWRERRYRLGRGRHEGVSWPKGGLCDAMVCRRGVVPPHIFDCCSNVYVFVSSSSVGQE